MKTEMSSKTYDQPDAVQAHDPAGDPWAAPAHGHCG